MALQKKDAVRYRATLSLPKHSDGEAAQKRIAAFSAPTTGAMLRQRPIH
jgi:hypothetical protein